MTVKMIYGLAAVGLAVDHEPSALFLAALAFGKLLGPV